MALSCVACGSSPTQPAAPGAITITSLSPASPTASSVAQTLTATGSNFATGLSVSLRLADGSSSMLSSAQLHDVTTSSFQITVTLSAVGADSLTATNTSGSASSAFGFTVQAAPVVAPTPSILSLTPLTVVQGGGMQTINVSGTNFVANLGATATAPDGTSLTIDASQIQNVTTTSCQIGLVFIEPGRYQLTVNAPSGPPSNAVTIQVVLAAQSFTLSGTVQDNDGGLAPIAGATVIIVGGEWTGRSADTDANGNYNISGISGPMTVSAAKNGYVSHGISITLVADQTLNMALSRIAELASAFFSLSRPGAFAHARADAIEAQR